MTPTTLSPQAQEWRKEAERLIVEYGVCRYVEGLAAMGRDETLPPGPPTGAHEPKAALLAHLDAVPFNQVVQEPPFVRESQLKELFEPYATNMGLRDFEESEYGYTNSRTAGPWGWFKAGADAFRSALRAASPQPAQPGEALPAEQPKSDQANLESASGGNDLQTALPEQPSRRREDWLLWDRCYDRQQGKDALSFLDCVSLFADAVRRVALPVAGLSDAQIKAAWLEVGTGPNGDNLAGGTNLTGWTNAVRWAESRHGIGPALAAAPAARNDVRGLLRIADQSRTERRHPVRLRKGAVRNHGAEAMTNQADKPSELVINQQKTPENGAISLVDQLMELARQYARAYFNCYTYEKVDESADLIERRSALRAYAERLASQSAADRVLRVLDLYGVRFGGDCSDPAKPYSIHISVPGRGQTNCCGATVREAAQVALDWLGESAAAPPIVDLSDERAKFEAWAKTQDVPENQWWLRQLPDGGYSSSRVDDAWLAWQARAILAARE